MGRPVIIAKRDSAPIVLPQTGTVELYLSDEGVPLQRDETGEVKELGADNNPIARATVANQAARFALTTADVQTGDYVLQSDNGILYEVTDDAELDSSAGYTALATVTSSQISDASAAGRALLTAANAAAQAALLAVTPYNAGNLTGDVTLSLANGGTQYGYMSGNTTFQVPTGTPAECVSEITVIVRWADGAHTLDFHADIQRASDSAATFPKTLTAWKSYIFKLKYMGGAWCLVSLTGGFTEFVD